MLEVVRAIHIKHKFIREITRDAIFQVISIINQGITAETEETKHKERQLAALKPASADDQPETPEGAAVAQT